MSSSDESANDARAVSVAQFAKDLATLVRSEIDSAREEMAEKAKSAGIGAGMLSGSAVAALLALGSLTALAIVALSLAIPPWAATLAISLIWTAAAVVLALLGKKKVVDAAPFLPERTIEEAKEDLQWARSGAKSPRR